MCTCTSLRTVCTIRGSMTIFEPSDLASASSTFPPQSRQSFDNLLDPTHWVSLTGLMEPINGRLLRKQLAPVRQSLPTKVSMLRDYPCTIPFRRLRQSSAPARFLTVNRQPTHLRTMYSIRTTDPTFSSQAAACLRLHPLTTIRTIADFLAVGAETPGHGSIASPVYPPEKQFLRPPIICQLLRLTGSLELDPRVVRCLADVCFLAVARFLLVTHRCP